MPLMARMWLCWGMSMQTWFPVVGWLGGTRTLTDAARACIMHANHQAHWQVGTVIRHLLRAERAAAVQLMKWLRADCKQHGAVAVLARGLAGSAGHSLQPPPGHPAGTYPMTPPPPSRPLFAPPPISHG